MLEGIRPSQLHGASTSRLSRARSPPSSMPVATATAMGAEASEAGESHVSPIASAPGKGVSKWKNKLKNFLTTTPKNGAPSSSKAAATPRAQLEEEQDVSGLFGGADEGSEVADISVHWDEQQQHDDSYEARLSKLVGDLEGANYNASSSTAIHPYAASNANTPSAGGDTYGGIGIEDALSSFTQPYSDIFDPNITFASFSDIQVPDLASGASPTPTEKASHTASSASTSNSSNDPQSNRPADASKDFLYKGMWNEQKPSPALFPGDSHTAPVPFNSPVDGLPVTESTNMPFSFEDLQKMGLVEGGTLDIGGGFDDGDTDFSQWITTGALTGSDDSTQSSGSSGKQAPSTLKTSHSVDLSHFNLDLFPIPSMFPSPLSDASSGPSPALSYGESSTSFEETPHPDPSSHAPLPRSQSNGVHGLFKGEAQVAIVTTPTLSPKPSLSSISIPPTPSSYKTAPSSAPSTPHHHRTPVKVHASALKWRVAPTSASTSIAIDSRPLRTSSSQNFLSSDPFAASNTSGPTNLTPRLNRLNTVSSPELKRRRQEDEEQDNEPDSIVRSPSSRPIAGRRRVASKMHAPGSGASQVAAPKQYVPSYEAQQQYSHLQQMQQRMQHQRQNTAPQPQLLRQQVPQSQPLVQHQRTHSQPTYAPPQQQSQSWITDDVLRSLISKTNEQSYLCLIQGCHQSLNNELAARSHVLAHFSGSSQVPQQQPAPTPAPSYQYAYQAPHMQSHLQPAHQQQTVWI